ncbi:MAG: hypothetical protein R3B90_11325 [Planctomycetaceae bacterium]
MHGDVWLVDGITTPLTKLRWKRFASGLYQPMGVKVIKGNIYVLERGQITHLRATRTTTARLMFTACIAATGTTAEGALLHLPRNRSRQETSTFIPGVTRTLPTGARW